MKKVSLKKSMTMCLVSALIASSMGTMAFAVEPSDTVTDNSVVVSEQSAEVSVVSEVSEEESKVESVAESSVEDSGGTEESSKQVSTVEESSKVEESSEVDLKELELKVNFGGTFAKKSFSNEKGYIDYSNVVFKIYTPDKSKLIKTFNISNTDLGSAYGSSDTKTMKIEVPSWKEGVSYKVVVSNLPSIYDGSTQEFDIKYSNSLSETNKVYVNESIIDLKLKDANCIIFLYNMKNKPISSTVDVKGYDAEENCIYTKEGVQIGSDGVGALKLSDTSIKSLGFSMRTPVNNEAISGETIVPFDANVAINIEPLTVALTTNIDLNETPLDDNGEAIDGKSATVTINADFKDVNDMTFFNHTDIVMGIYKSSTLMGTFTVSKDSPKQSFTLVDGNKYTIKAVGSVDYEVTVDKSTFTASEGTVLNVTAVPAHFITVVNDKKEGAICNVSVNGKEYRGKTKYIFAVNDTNGLTIKNLDTDEMYSVAVSDYKDTTIDIKDGSIDEKGFVGTTGNETENSTVNSDNENVPKTGDTILLVVSIIGGIGLLFGAGYIYYRKKGSKFNESKK